MPRVLAPTESQTESQGDATPAAPVGQPARGDRPALKPRADEEYELSYSVRLVQPFLRVLRPIGMVPDDWLGALDSLDLDFRLPAAVAHQMLEVAAAASGDDAIGLKAAQECNPGDGGALDYAISSASTVREAIEAAARYTRLVNDALEIRLQTVENAALVRVDNRVALSRQAVDFQLGAIFRAFWCIWASGARQSVRVLLSHDAPNDTTEYARTFLDAPVEFGASFSGFVFDSACLGTRLASAEFGLHEVILRHAEKMLQELPRARQLTERVRNAIAAELAGGNPSVTHIARRLHMSPRTLERKLEREGTTFSTLLDELRRRLAFRYVGTEDLELAEVAFLLGFSQTTGFHRAFKRWTGETPLNYRRARRRESS